MTQRTSDQRDAARYRYLRNQPGKPTPEEFDAAIDADMEMDGPNSIRAERLGSTPVAPGADPVCTCVTPDWHGPPAACAVHGARTSNPMAALLRRARDFVMKSRCSEGHSVSEVWDRAKPTHLKHCIYCASQVALYKDLEAEIARTADETPACRCVELGYTCPTCCAASVASAMRSCNACTWKGPATDCVHPKHDPSTLLCPECHETTDGDNDV
jgi:hypothetical protein